MTHLLSDHTLLNIFGHPVSGKSSLVERIMRAQDGIYCVDFDVIKRQLSGYAWQRDKDFGRQLTHDTLRLVVKSGKPIVLLAPPPRSEAEYQSYFEPVVAAGYRVINVLVTAGRDVLLERYRQRLDSIRQNNPDFKVKTFEEYTATLNQEIYSPPSTIILDSGQLDRQQLYDELAGQLSS